MRFKISKLVNGNKLVEDITHGARKTNRMHKGIILNDPQDEQNKGHLILFDNSKANTLKDDHNSLKTVGLHSIIAFIQPITSKDYLLMDKKHKVQVKKYLAQNNLK